MNPPNGKRCEFVMEVTNKTRADVKVNADRCVACPTAFTLLQM